MPARAVRLLRAGLPCASLPVAASAAYPHDVQPPAASPSRRRAAERLPKSRASAAGLVGAGLVLGLALGWLAGLVRVRKP